MSLVLCALAVTFMCVAGWGFQSVVAELDNLSVQPTDAISRKFQVDEFIWSARASLSLRRRYIATQACAVPACLCLAALVWLNAPRPDIRALGAIAFCAVALLVAASLTWKIASRSK